jgi:hypothetical protein
MTAKSKGWLLNGAKTGKASAGQFGVMGALWWRFTVMKNKTLQIIEFILYCRKTTDFRRWI